MDVIAAPPLTPAKEFAALSAEIHSLDEKRDGIEHQAASIRVAASFEGNKVVKLEELRSEHQRINIEIQKRLPRWSELKLELQKG